MIRIPKPRSRRYAKLPKIGRRTLLRGAAGTAVALPWLTAMNQTSSAKAQTGKPERYVVCMTGTSPTAGARPANPGPLELPTAYVDLEPVKDYVSIVSGLTIPSSGGSSNPARGGVQSGANHGTMLLPMVTGYRHRGGRRETNPPGGPSSDQAIARVHGGATPFSSLQYRVQPRRYGSGGVHGHMSYRPDGSHIDPVSSPRVAYDALFAGVSDGPDLPSAGLDRGQSVLDLVLARANRLSGELSAVDRQRLERHFDEIRGLERQMVQLPEGSCSPFADPGQDPDTQLGTQVDQQGPRQMGWSDETRRADIFSDLIRTAFACDLSRVVSYMFGFLTSDLSMEVLFDVAWNAHGITHGPFDADVGGGRANRVRLEATRWFTGLYAQLVQKLHDTPEAGGNLLDNTVAVLLWEHGAGQAENGGSTGAHLRTNITVTVAGRPDVLNLGRHIDGNGRHPANVMQSAMEAMNVGGDLGELPGTVSELLR
ncbi:MAG: DUF1552 domain-containing protein [Myxococcota bacterium]